MSSITTSAVPHFGGTLKLPPSPDTMRIRAQITARLHEIENLALPALAAQRRLLEQVWRSDAPDAVLLYAHEYHIVPTHPAGADRLAIVLAEQHGLMLEADALRELGAALDRYDAGGSALAAEVEANDVEIVQLIAAPTVAPAPELSVADERANTLQLLRYLGEVRSEIWAARRARDEARRQQLEEESRQLEAFIRDRSIAVRAASTAAAAEPVSRTG